MKRTVGNEPEGGSKKRKDVGNDNSLASMFAKQQTVSVLNKARDTYNVQLQKGKQMGLDKASHTESDLGLEMWFSMISSRIISFQKVMVQSRQVLHPFLPL